MSQGSLNDPTRLHDADGVPVVVGQTTAAASLPTVLASDQPPVPVTATSLPLPTGAATEATLSALNTNTADIETIVTAIRDTAGIKKITDALPAGTNNIGDVDVVSSALPTGAATETTLASIDTKTLAAGQAVMAASSPVVLASNQSEVASKNAAASQVDGHSASIGATADADTALTVIGRLKQLLTRLPAALIGGRLDSNIGSWLGATTPTVGQKANAACIPVSLATEQIGVPGSAAPAQAYPMAAKQNGVTTLRALATKYDATEAEYRLMVDAKVQIAPPDPPPATTPKVLVGYSVVPGNSSTDTSYVIPNGMTLTVQQATIGAEGDPNERGSQISLIYNNGTEHDVEVYFASSFSSEFFPSTNKAVDGTVMVGNGTHTFVIRRIRLGGGSALVRCVVRGYEA